MKYCTQCGTPNPGHGCFCTACGTTLGVPPFAQGVDEGTGHVPASTQSPGRLRLSRGSFLAAAAAVLTVALAVYFLYPSRGKTPPGWNRYSGKANGFSVSCPPDWKFMSADDIKARTGGALQPLADEVFCMNTKDEIQRFEISGFAVPKGDIREFLREQQPKDAELNKEEREHLVSQKICELAGGVASVTIIDGWQQRRIHVICKVVLLVVNKKGVHITCCAESGDFDEVDRKVFQPMLDSFGAQ